MSSDDGGKDARAAEAAGVDVGGMLEAGVDAEHLLEFVAAFRNEEGHKLGLLDKQNLKFATSQVLREGPKAGADVVYSQFATKRSRRASLPEKDEGSTASLRPSVTSAAKTTSSTSDPCSPPNDRLEGISSANNRSACVAGTRPSVPPSYARVLEKGDGGETARLCDELSRWSSALEGAERHLGGRGGSARMGIPTGGSGDHAQHGTEAVPTGGVLEEGSEQSTSTKENDQYCRRDDRSPTHRDTQDEAVRPRSAREAGRRGDRRRPRELGDDRVNDDRDWSSSSEGIGDNDEAWERIDKGHPSAPWRQGLGTRGGVASNGHTRPTPSYALPTKHFKALDRDRRHALYAADAHGQKQMQRQAHLEEENSALKLRLEGQRRTIHELEYRANTLREEARIRRQEEASRLKKRVATITSTTNSRGKCPCGANTLSTALRTVGDTGPSALKKRALAAEARARSLERCLSKSKAAEQRTREIVAYLKHNYSATQAKVANLEAELESTKNTLSESRKEAKGRIKATRKQRRQQGAKEKEAEIARADAADLAGFPSVRTRQALREIEKAQLDAIELREDKERMESESKNLARENRMLQDRLNNGNIRSRVQERDRGILAELRWESGSPAYRSPEQFLFHREPPGASHAQRQPLPRRSTRTRVGDDGGVWRRRQRSKDFSLESTSGSESPLRCRSLSPSAQTGAPLLPPKDRRSVSRVAGWTGRTLSPRGGAARALSIRSADGTESALGDSAMPRGSTLSGENAHATMRARYERLQAMYRRVNRRAKGT
ncbi:unnamed protein product [Scytosiphon promiscuus]